MARVPKRKWSICFSLRIMKGPLAAVLLLFFACALAQSETGYSSHTGYGLGPHDEPEVTWDDFRWEGGTYTVNISADCYTCKRMVNEIVFINELDQVPYICDTMPDYYSRCNWLLMEELTFWERMASEGVPFNYYPAVAPTAKNCVNDDDDPIYCENEVQASPDATLRANQHTLCTLLGHCESNAMCQGRWDEVDLCDGGQDDPAASSCYATGIVISDLDLPTYDNYQFCEAKDTEFCFGQCDNTEARWNDPTNCGNNCLCSWLGFCVPCERYRPYPGQDEAMVQTVKLGMGCDDSEYWPGNFMPGP